MSSTQVNKRGVKRKRGEAPEVRVKQLQGTMNDHVGLRKMSKLS
jgi:hypothetical protein